MQSAVPSKSESVSGLPHPHAPGAVLSASIGQPSLQLGVPSKSESASDTPQPQAPGSVLVGSSGQRSHAYPPTVFVQVPGAQGSGTAAHSSTSAQTRPVPS